MSYYQSSLVKVCKVWRRTNMKRSLWCCWLSGWFSTFWSVSGGLFISM